MEWRLSATRKVEYDKLLKAAQDVELNIGAAEYRKNKLVRMREQIDIDVKKWWDEVSVELKFDKDKDYMLGPDGTIKEVPRQQQAGQGMVPADVSEVKPESKIGTNANELKQEYIMDKRKKKDLDYPELVKFLKRHGRKSPNEAATEAFRRLYQRPRKRKK